MSIVIKSNRHLVAESAHIPHILVRRNFGAENMFVTVCMFVIAFIIMSVCVHGVEGVDDAARTEKEQRLEKGMCCQVKKSSDGNYRHQSPASYIPIG